MTDIVERLREVAVITTGLLYSRREMLMDAADEIELLRHEAVKRLKTLTDANDNSARYCAEIEALEAERDDLQKALDSAEIEHGLSDNGNLWRWWSAKAKELVKKQAELEADKNQALDLCAAAIEDYNTALSVAAELAKALGQAKDHAELPDEILDIIDEAIAAYRKEASE